MGKTIGPGPWCGTSGGYTNHSCRCERCREAWRIKHLEYMNAHPEQQEKNRARNRRKYAERKGDV